MGQQWTPPSRTGRRSGVTPLVVVGVGIAVVALIGVLLGRGSSNSGGYSYDTPYTVSHETPNETTYVEATAPGDGPPKPTTMKEYVYFHDGDYLVGVDIPPGTYRSDRHLDDCQWQREGAGASVLAAGSGPGPAVVTIQPGDVSFHSRGCREWSSYLAQVTPRKTVIEQGTYIVGTDVEPGTYEHDSSSSCSWFRLSGFGLPHDQAIARGDGSAATVTILASDAGFESAGCGIWTVATGSGASAAVPSAASPSPTPNAPTSANPPTPAKSTGPLVIRTFGSGTYGVGIDIPPGIYRTIENDWLYTCQWGVYGPGGSVRAVGVGGWGQIVVTIDADAVTFSSGGCGSWTNDIHRGTKAATTFDQGTFIVGVDIEPGTYTSPGGYSCMWFRLSGFGNPSRYAIQSGDGSQTTVTILASDQGFQSLECGTWTRK